MQQEAMTDLPTLHHYTTPAGLLGIVQNRELWMTDVRFMNDSSELDWPLQVIAEALTSVESPSLGPAREVIEALRRPNAPVFEMFNVYAMSFCGEPDLLSQWRGYAGDQGFAIEFDRDAFGSDCWPMDYDRASSLRTVQTLVNRFIAEARKLPADIPVDDPAFFSVFREFAWDLFTAALKMKHPSFREEGEARFVLLGKKDDVSSIRFRQSRYGLVPYVPVGRFNNKWQASEADQRERLPILSVTCGPAAHPRLGEAAVKTLLDQTGYTDVTVVSSTIPLRT